MKIKPPYRPYMITGFVLSGWLFWFAGRVKLPDERVQKWEAIEIPSHALKRVYFWLELKRKIKEIFKRRNHAS